MKLTKIASAAFGGCMAMTAMLGIGPVATLTSAALDTPTVATAEALPGQCGGAIVIGNGGSFCDFDAWPDGSFMHSEQVCVLGICGWNTFRACHVPGGRVPADNNPATPC